MEDLISEFIAETGEMLEALGGEIVAWEAAPDDRARLDAIFRFVHTVKGNCGFFDLPRLQALSHAAEDALSAVRSGRRVPDRRLVDAVLAVVDRIGELVQALEAGENIADGDDRHLVDALAPGSAAAPDGPAPDERAPEHRRSLRSIRLSVDLLDRMMSEVSDLVLARNDLARRLRDREGQEGVNAAFDRLSSCIADMRDAVTLTRMQRIETLFAGLPRMVRDLAAELGKEVALEVDGGDVELDREMIETIRDPLTHIIRNAVDHGLEPPAERSAAGKPAAGLLRVCARQSGNQILIEVSDDGRGIDGERLVREAVAAGSIPVERAGNLCRAQKLALVFEPGLSTAGEVTAISGRGVGMDVVRANIERIGGIVELDSSPGRGLRLALRVPLTLTIIPALTVVAAGQVYAIPRSAIEEIVRTGRSGVRIDSVGGARVAAIRDRNLPLVPLASVLGIALEAAAREEHLVVLRTASGDLYALLVDAVLDHEELVVKPASPLVMASGLYGGTTLGEDGRPILLLDAAGIAAVADLRPGLADLARSEPGAAAAPAKQAATPALLFRTLEGVTRAVRLAEVERIEDVAADAVRFAGGRLRVVLGEEIVPLAGCSRAPERPIRVLRLSDGAREIAYALAEVIDIVSLGSALKPAAAPGEVAGVTLVDGEQVELLDTYWLFAAHAAEPAEAARPVCAIPDEPWMINILRPILEGAGYAVAAAGTPEARSADVAIVSGHEPPGVAVQAPVVKLRAEPRPAGSDDDSIYRYDRDALLREIGARAGSRRRA